MTNGSRSHQKNRKKRNRKSKSRSKRTAVIDIDDFDSAEESDGQSALRAVQEKEHARDYSGRRGPIGQTRKHWHDPTPAVEPGKEPNRWKFQCRYCKAYVIIYLQELSSELTSAAVPALSNKTLLVLPLRTRSPSLRSAISAPISKILTQHNGSPEKLVILLLIHLRNLRIMGTPRPVRRSWTIF